MPLSCDTLPGDQPTQIPRMRTRRAYLRRERGAPDLPCARCNLCVAHFATAEALRVELRDDAPAHRVKPRIPRTSFSTQAVTRLRPHAPLCI